MKNSKLFLHGLDSSSRGTKGRWFSDNFPDMILPDFSGELPERLDQLETICDNRDNLTLVGSSFGGLMATCYAASHPHKCKNLILLAPALNFANYRPPETKITVPCLLIIGNNDEVTPPSEVLPLAHSSFEKLEIKSFADDHLLHKAFYQLDWPQLLGS